MVRKEVMPSKDQNCNHKTSKQVVKEQQMIAKYLSELEPQNYFVGIRFKLCSILSLYNHY